MTEEAEKKGERSQLGQNTFTYGYIGGYIRVYGYICATPCLTCLPCQPRHQHAPAISDGGDRASLKMPCPRVVVVEGYSPPVQRLGSS